MVIDRLCECCGQTLPLPFEVGIGFSKGQRALVEAIYFAGAHGIQSDRLIDKMYGDDPTGGPDDARKAIHVRVWQANQKLQARGWRISARGDHNGIYVLEKIAVTPLAAAKIISDAMGET